MTDRRSPSLSRIALACSLGGEVTVDGQGRPGDEGGLVAEQVRHEARDLGRAGAHPMPVAPPVTITTFDARRPVMDRSSHGACAAAPVRFAGCGPGHMPGRCRTGTTEGLRAGMLSAVRTPWGGHPSGAIAQLVERLHGMQEVRGSTPRSSTAGHWPFPGSWRGPVLVLRGSLRGKIAAAGAPTERFAPLGYLPSVRI